MHIGITLWKRRDPGDLSSTPIDQQMLRTQLGNLECDFYSFF